jgi:hypothetical protein
MRQHLLTGFKPEGFDIGFNHGLVAGQSADNALYWNK